MKKNHEYDWRAERIATIGSAGMVIILTLVVFLIYNTGVIRGINPVADKHREDIITENMLNSHVEGTFFDRTGVALTHSDGPGKIAEIIYPNEFSYIIGTRNTIGQLSGLRNRLKYELFDMGKKHKDTIGADVTLTIDIGLQQFATNLLKGHTGSINVINADTGEILCMAARGDDVVDFNANEYLAVYNTIPSFTRNRAIIEAHSFGSTMKILTTMLILENDIEQSYLVEDPYVTSSGKKIVNSTTALDNTEADLQAALYYSCNTYFATRGLLIGTEKFKELARKLYIGEDLHLDFTDLTDSNFDPVGDDPEYELASTAYGQGKTQISPLHMTAIMAAIMNENRNMLKPYLISSIVNEEKTVHTGETEILSKNITKKSVMKDLHKLFHKTAVDAYGFPEESKNYGYVIAKSGTAQTEDDTKNHVYMLFGYSYKEKNYAMCIDWANVPTSVFGKDLIPSAKSLIEYINKTNI